MHLQCVVEANQMQFWLQKMLQDQVSGDLKLRVVDGYYKLNIDGMTGSLFIDRENILCPNTFAVTSRIHKRKFSVDVSNFLEDDFIFLEKVGSAPLFEEGRPSEYFLVPKILDYIFWMVNRIEEYSAERILDSHYRYNVESSIAYKQKFIDRPIVDEYIWLLKALVLHIWPSAVLKDTEYEFRLSCDIDHPFLSSRSRLSVYKQAAGNVLRGYGLFSSLDDVYLFEKSRIFGYSHDAFFRGIQEVSLLAEKYDLNATFFLLLDTTSVKYDGIVNVDSDEYVTLIKSLFNSDHLIGIHPGYFCDDDHLFLRAISKFDELVKNFGGSQLPLVSRMHYLRFDIKTYLRQVEVMNIVEDHSLGYTEVMGFRSGTARPFCLYNMQNGDTSETIFYPLHIMDHSILQGRNKDSDVRKALNHAEKIKRRVQFYGGVLSVLWHNSSLNTIVERGAFESLLDIR